MRWKVVMALMVLGFMGILGSQRGWAVNSPSDEPGWNGKAKMSGSEGFYLGCRWISSAKDIPVPEEVKEGWEKLLRSARIENGGRRQNILAQWRLQWQKEEFRKYIAEQKKWQESSTGMGTGIEPSVQTTTEIPCPPSSSQCLSCCHGCTWGLNPKEGPAVPCNLPTCGCRAVFWVEAVKQSEEQTGWVHSSACECLDPISFPQCVNCWTPVYTKRYNTNQESARMCIAMGSNLQDKEIKITTASTQEWIMCSKTLEKERCPNYWDCCPHHTSMADYPRTNSCTIVGTCELPYWITCGTVITTVLCGGERCQS